MSDSNRDMMNDGFDAVNEHVGKAADAAAEAFDDGVNDLRDHLKDGADAVRDGVRSARARTSDAKRRVSQALDESTDFFRENGPRGVAMEVESLFRRHPGLTMIALVATGFVLGQTMKRR